MYFRGEEALVSVFGRLVDGSGAWEAPLCLRFEGAWASEVPDSGSESEPESVLDVKQTTCRQNVYGVRTVYVDRFIHLRAGLRVICLCAKYQIA